MIQNIYFRRSLFSSESDTHRHTHKDRDAAKGFPVHSSLSFTLKMLILTKNQDKHSYCFTFKFISNFKQNFLCQRKRTWKTYMLRIFVSCLGFSFMYVYQNSLRSVGVVCVVLLNYLYIISYHIKYICVNRYH